MYQVLTFCTNNEKQTVNYVKGIKIISGRCPIQALTLRMCH